MRRKKTYKMPHRRRRDGRTNYSVRLKHLRSGKPRFVIRKSSNNITCQIVEYDKKGDRVIVSISSKDLKEIGWKGSCGNIPAAYLIGLLCGSKGKDKKIKTTILDIGLQISTKGSRIYAALKGAIDAGLDIPHSEEIIPKEERLSGKHISNHAERLKKEKHDKYKNTFSKYKIPPENITKHFEEIKQKILK